MTWFSRETDPLLWTCSCKRPACDAPAPTPTLLAKLERLRGRVDRPIIVTSGPRCAYWNAKQKGKPRSEHLTGEGADLAVRSSRERAELLEMIYRAPAIFTRIGIGPEFVHVGTSATHDDRVAWTYYRKVAAKAKAARA